MAVNKVVYNAKVLIDLTGDTVTAAKLAKGVTAHDKSGAPITGTLDITKETWTFTLSSGSTVTKEVYINA